MVPSMSQEQMHAALTALDQAAYNHDEWCGTLFATLICRLKPDDRDIDPDAHRKCRFGQWYYCQAPEMLRSQPGFAELETEHRLMHHYAADMLRASESGRAADIGDYERFVNALKRMRLEMETLHHEIEDALFNLDPLTGASSRIGMLTKLREQQEMVRRGVHSSAIAMMDIDHFKSVNDTYGHGVGDAVLKAVVNQVSVGLRPYDRIFRYGGEEFLILMAGVDLDKSCDAIERLREEIASLTHAGNGKGQFHISVSFGLTLLDPDVPVEQSIERADRALYAAKAKGRNCVVVWDASMDAKPAMAKGSPTHTPRRAAG